LIRFDYNITRFSWQTWSWISGSCIRQQKPIMASDAVFVSALVDATERDG
jgi:hypothetical protein